MATNTPILLKRFNGTDYDKLQPETTWTQVLDKPTTFTPTAHTHTKSQITDFAHSHGNITDTGTITADTAIASGQKLVLVNGSNQVVRSALALGSSTTTFLRNDGQWVTPAGGGTVTGTGTANQITYWTGISSIAALSTATYPSLTELSYVKGVTSALQTQLNGKAATSHTHAAGDITSGVFATSIFNTTIGQNTNSATINTDANTQRLLFFGSMSGFTTIRVAVWVNWVDIPANTTVIYRYVWNNGAGTFSDNLSINRGAGNSFTFAQSAGNSPWTYRIYRYERV
jgi:hypothetical protein